MTVVSGGIVRYERSVKVAEYENKKMGIELSFALADDETDLAGALDTVGDQAVAFVHGKLGIVTAPARARATKDAKVDVKDAAPANDKVATAAALKAEDSKKKVTKPPAPPVNDAVDMDGPATTGQATTGQAISGGGERKESDDLSFLDEPETEVNITDQQLVDTIGRVNAKIKNPVAIKQAIAKYAGQPPRTYKDVPFADRAKFLADLAAL